MLHVRRLLRPVIPRNVHRWSSQLIRPDQRQFISHYSLLRSNNITISKRMLTQDSSWENLKGFQRQDYLLQQASLACTDADSAVKYTNFYLKYTDILPFDTMNSMLVVLLMHKHDREACIVAEQFIQWYLTDIIHDNKRVVSREAFELIIMALGRAQKYNVIYQLVGSNVTLINNYYFHDKEKVNLAAIDVLNSLIESLLIHSHEPKAIKNLENVFKSMLSNNLRDNYNGNYKKYLVPIKPSLLHQMLNLLRENGHMYIKDDLLHYTLDIMKDIIKARQGLRDQLHGAQPSDATSDILREPLTPRGSITNWITFESKKTHAGIPTLAFLQNILGCFHHVEDDYYVDTILKMYIDEVLPILPRKYATLDIEFILNGLSSRDSGIGPHFNISKDKSTWKVEKGLMFYERVSSMNEKLLSIHVNSTALYMASCVGNYSVIRRSSDAVFGVVSLPQAENSVPGFIHRFDVFNEIYLRASRQYFIAQSQNDSHSFKKARRDYINEYFKKLKRSKVPTGFHTNNGLIYLAFGDYRRSDLRDYLVANDDVDENERVSDDVSKVINIDIPSYADIRFMASLIRMCSERDIAESSKLVDLVGMWYTSAVESIINKNPDWYSDHLALMKDRYAEQQRQYQLHGGVKMEPEYTDSKSDANYVYSCTYKNLGYKLGRAIYYTFLKFGVATYGGVEYSWSPNFLDNIIRVCNRLKISYECRLALVNLYELQGDGIFKYIPTKSLANIVAMCFKCRDWLSVTLIYEILQADPNYKSEEQLQAVNASNESVPRHPSWYQLNALLSLGRYEDAVKHLGTMDSSTISIDTYRRICMTLAQNDKLEFAESIYQSVMKMHESNKVDSTLDNMEIVGKIDLEMSSLYSARAVWLANAEEYDLLESHLVGASRKINSYSHYKVVNGIINVLIEKDWDKSVYFTHILLKNGYQPSDKVLDLIIDGGIREGRSLKTASLIASLRDLKSTNEEGGPYA